MGRKIDFLKNIKLSDDINFQLVSFTYFDTKFHNDFHFYVVIIHLLIFLNIIFIWDFIKFVFLLSKLNSYFEFSWVTGSTNQAEISSIIILDFLATFSSANLSIAYSLLIEFYDLNFTILKCPQSDISYYYFYYTWFIDRESMHFTPYTGQSHVKSFDESEKDL